MQKELRGIVQEHINALANDDRVRPKSLDIQKDVWASLVIERMRANDPQAWLALSMSAPLDAVQRQIAEFLHKGRAPAAVDIRDFGKSIQAAKKNETVHAIYTGSEWISKRYIDLTPREADALATQYARQGLAFSRKAAQIRSDVAKARQLGLGEDQSFSVIMNGTWVSYEDQSEATG